MHVKNTYSSPFVDYVCVKDQYKETILEDIFDIEAFLSFNARKIMPLVLCCMW